MLTPLFFTFISGIQTLMKNNIWIIFLLTAFFAQGQYDYSSTCIKAHMEVSALRFDNATRLLEEEYHSNEDNLVPVMISGYKDFLSIIVGEEEKVFDSLYDLRSVQFSKLGDGDTDSPWYNYSLARLYLQWAFARVKFGSYFNAARDIRRSYLLLNENKDAFPEFLPNNIGLGILHALIGTIPDNYRWIANVFSMRGSVEQGRAELLHVMERAEEEGYPYLLEEALFFLSFIELNLQPENEKAGELLPYYGSNTDSNLMLIFSKSRILMQTGHNDEAIDLLSNHPKDKAYFPFYYLDYLTGQAKLNRLDDDADKYFILFTANFKGASYVKSAYQRLAWSAQLRGDQNGYHEYMEKVKLYGDDFTDGDKIALQDANSGEIPNTCLLKARLLYDGGYYHKADSILDHGDCILSTEKDHTEFPYRKGRISHSAGNREAAIIWYGKTIEIGREQTYYFAANAALQTALIYESSGEYDRAEEYFKMCTSMPKREYRTSLDQKAKAGLNRLEDKRTHEE